MLTNFVQREFVDKGMIADVAFHRGHVKGEAQPHGHVLLTLREINSEGFGQKARLWNAKKLLNTWRVQWAEYCNLALSKAGFECQIDHRTLEAQGIELEAQSKIGPTSVKTVMARFEEHQALAARNGERLLKDPIIALNALTRTQSTFTHHDLAQFVSRHTVDANQFEQVYEKIKAHSEIVYLGQDDQQRSRFTTQEMLSLETIMVEQAVKKAKSSLYRMSDEAITNVSVNQRLSEEQYLALKHITQGEDVACVVGFAGTGKSYLLGAAREVWEAAGFRVQGLTLTGIAADNLAESSGIKSHTVANRFWHWDEGNECLGTKDILVVDEAGMLGSRQLARIIAEAYQHKAKVILVGDTEQLQAIEAGAAFRAIAERIGYVELSDIRRQYEAWQRVATRDFACARTADGLLAYENHGYIHTFDTREAAVTRLLENWESVRNEFPEKSQLLLAYTRDEVRELNERARSILQTKGELGSDYIVETFQGSRHFAVGDRIYFLRNDYHELQVKNGTLGTIEFLDGKQLTVRLDTTSGSRQINVNLAEYNALDHGYAATVYKAQGVTVDRAYVLASSYFDRHTTYVAMSRHREEVAFYVNREDFPSAEKLTRTLSRARVKDLTLDYSLAQAYHLDGNHSDSKNILDTEEQLARQHYGPVFQRELATLEKRLGTLFSLVIKEGDRGIYRGMIEIAGQQYGLLQLNQDRIKLIEYSRLKSPRKSQIIVTKKQHIGLEKYRLVGVSSEKFEKERSVDNGRER